MHQNPKSGSCTPKQTPTLLSCNNDFKDHHYSQAKIVQVLIETAITLLNIAVINLDALNLTAP